jgi:hypothetical protein
MELKSFKELLLKKAADNPNLQSLIDVIKDEIIAEKVLESLEKMARPQATMGRSANAAVTAFGNQLKNKDVEMMRDALGHHISHYKAALKNGNREVADQHLNKIIPMMHLAARAGAHSNGQLGLDYVPLEPWETNYTTIERRPETGKLKEGTKGLRRRLNSTPRDKNPRSVPDYHYLEMSPHEEHADSKKSPHKGGYPFEEIQLGNPAKIDSKEAYLHITDPGKQDKFVPHPFDEHPIHNFAEHKQDSLDENDLKDFADKMTNWHGSEHNAKWMQSIKDAHAADPEGFKSRGKVKPGHHYEGIELKTQPHKMNAPISNLPEELKQKYGNKNEQPKAEEVVAPKVQATSQQNVGSDVINNLPPALRAKFGGNK